MTRYYPINQNEEKELKSMKGMLNIPIISRLAYICQNDFFSHR